MDLMETFKNPKVWKPVLLEQGWCSASHEGDESVFDLCHNYFIIDELQNDGSCADHQKYENLRGNLVLIRIYIWSASQRRSRVLVP